MYSQSLFAQLVRMIIALALMLFLVHHYQPLLKAFSANATDIGCHQMPENVHVQHQSAQSVDQ